MKKTVAIVGLGLIGGSFAKALKDTGDYHLIGFDCVEKVLSDAKFLGDIDEIGSAEALTKADWILIALHPRAAVEFVAGHCRYFRKGAIVVDMCGVKMEIAKTIDPLAQAQGFVYIGGHPMAGKEFSGFAYSDGKLFCGASMLLVPGANARETHIALAEAFFSALGFGRVIITTGPLHDRMIAFTSQLAHVVSSAYIKSPAAIEQKGYSAGSYKDMTRVARLNEDMWTELFLMNREALTAEIDALLGHLQEYREAISSGDAVRLKALLREGRLRKEEIG